MVVIPGNHDSAARLAYAARFLQSQGIHVLTDPSQLDKPITIVREGQEVDIFGVPWLQGSSQIQAWQQALSRLQAAKRPGIPALLCAHLFTLGGHESDSERILVGEGEQIPVAWLEGWDYVALGHLHRTQQPAQRVWYSGSPMAYSFSEAATQTTAAPKHLLRVDLGPVPAVTPIGLSPLRPMSRLAGGFEDFLSNPKWAPFEGHLLELTLSDASLVSQPMDRLRARFPHLLTLLQTSQTASVSSQLPLPSAQAGSLRSDALAFLADLAPGTLEAGQPWVDRLSVEVQRETP
jgi:exonuclease SbcD